MVSFDPRISSLSMYQWHWISAPEGVCGSCNGSSVLCFHFGGEFLTAQCRSAWPLLNSVASLGRISAHGFGGWVMVVAAWVILVPHWLAVRRG